MNSVSQIGHGAVGATTIYNGECRCFGAIITSDGTNDVTVAIADDTTTLITLKLDASLEGFTKDVPFPAPIKVTTNLKVTVTGTGGAADLFYGNGR